MKVIKRNGSEVVFDISKIITAITKANEAVQEDYRMTSMQIKRIAEAVELNCIRMNRAQSPSARRIYRTRGYTSGRHSTRWCCRWRR